jgi:hypothetical protein
MVESKKQGLAVEAVILFELLKGYSGEDKIFCVNGFGGFSTRNVRLYDATNGQQGGGW